MIGSLLRFEIKSVLLTTTHPVNAVGEKELSQAFGCSCIQLLLACILTSFLTFPGHCKNQQLTP
jgi:hypothetical protein